MKTEKDYRVHLTLVVILITMLVSLVSSSCASHCQRTRNYWSTHRCV